MDYINITGITVQGTHGVLAIEKEQPQLFVVDVLLQTDLIKAGTSDDLADTVCYAEVCDLVEKVVSGRSFNLLEKLATVIAEEILHRFLVEKVIITVHKPAAPLKVRCGDVSVKISLPK